MSESVRASIKKAMNRPPDEPAGKESARASVKKAMDKAPDKPPEKEDVRSSVERAYEEEEKESGPEYTKDEVDYGDGTRTEYCGICSHYQVMHKDGCELVKGFIEYDKWCKKWEEKPDEAVFVDA